MQPTSRAPRLTRATLFTIVTLLTAVMLAAHAAPNPAADSAAAAPSNATACRALGLRACPEPYDATLPRPADMLIWDQPTRIVGFRNTYRQYPGDVFHTGGGTPFPLPLAARPLPALTYELDGQPRHLDDYLRHQSVTGLLILKDGRVAYEYYGAGNTDKTLWTSRSVAKSVVSVLIGMAIKEGSIGSVTDPITQYLPELKGTAWDGVNLQELLQHTSGVAWNEDYADPSSDFAHLTRCEAAPDAYRCVMQLVSHVQRRPGIKPGERWSYNTGGAWLVGRILEKATHMTIARYLETHLWSRFPMQADGVWEALVKSEVDMGGHGFNATLRDWGRFALFVADGGKLPDGTTLLPADWLRRSTTWTQAQGSVSPATPDGQYGYQWWFAGVDPARPGATAALQTARESFWAEGIYGQAIAIDPAERLVMVQWSSWEKAEGPAALYDEQALFFSAVARSLRSAPRPPQPAPGTLESQPRAQ